MVRRVLCAVAVLLVAGVSFTFLARLCEGDDWPSYRGPDRTGISAETGWSAASPKVLWNANVGPGWSSLAVAGGRVYTMGNKNNEDIVWCLEADTGKVVWQKSYKCDAGDYPGPRATPATDGKSVYTFSRDGQLNCFDAATGKVNWSRQAGTRPPGWGYASSPLVLGSAVIVNAGGPGAAFNKSTGAPLWGGGGDAGHASVVPTEKGGKGSLLVFAGKALMSVNSSGRTLWSFPWDGRVNAADPLVINATTAFISSGYGKGCALVSWKSGVRAVWQNANMKNHFSSGVFYKDYIYGVDDDSGLRCLDVKTGAVKWSQGGFGKGGLILADGKLIVLAESGELVIADADPAGFKEISRTRAVRGQCWTAPVLANGRIYCRSGSGDVACLDVSGK